MLRLNRVHRSGWRALTLTLIAVLGLGSIVASGGGGGGGGGPAPSSSPANNPPIARAGPDRTVDELATIILDGTGSTDSDGTITAYQWTQTSGVVVVINDADQPQASFTAPIVSSDTVLEFQLVVTDDEGALAQNTVVITIQEAFFSLSGTISAAGGTTVDSDVNDPNTQSISNNLPFSAQSIPNPITIGGYVNVAGAGEPGPLQVAGDVSDFYRISLVTGQSITLFVADPAIGDPDLYLWDAAGVNILDASVNVGVVESLIAPATGEFLVEAFAFGGASNYVMVIGQTQTAGASGGFRLSDEFVPQEMIMRYSPPGNVNAEPSVAQPLMSRLGLQAKAGASDRSMLLSLETQTNRLSMFTPSDGISPVADRIEALVNDE